MLEFCDGHSLATLLLQITELCMLDGCLSYIFYVLIRFGFYNRTNEELTNRSRLYDHLVRVLRFMGLISIGRVLLSYEKII